MGISTHGDMDGMHFRVGMNYGLDFLAGRDIDYYIASKLDHIPSPYELDKEELEDFVANCIYHLSIEHPESFADGEGETVDIREDSSLTDIKMALLKLSDFLTDSRIDDINNALTDLGRVTCTEEAYRFLEEHGDALGQIDLMERSFKKRIYNMMFKLYMINHAARMIKEKCAVQE